MLQELENIDDDAEVAGIPIVKLEDKQLAKTVGVFALPAIVFFRFPLFITDLKEPGHGKGIELKVVYAVR